jgi:hypothetical protein
VITGTHNLPIPAHSARGLEALKKSLGRCTPAERFATRSAVGGPALDLTALAERRIGDDWISRRVASNGVISLSWQQFSVGKHHGAELADVHVTRGSSGAIMGRLSGVGRRASGGRARTCIIHAPSTDLTVAAPDDHLPRGLTRWPHTVGAEVGGDVDRPAAKPRAHCSERQPLTIFVECGRLIEALLSGGWSLRLAVGPRGIGDMGVSPCAQQ